MLNFLKIKIVSDFIISYEKQIKVFLMAFCVLILAINIQGYRSYFFEINQASVGSVINTNSIPSETAPKYQGYIIQFKTPTFIELKIQNAAKGINYTTVNSATYLNSLKTEHLSGLSDIKRLLSKSTLTPKREFYGVFNGISLDISSQEAEKIKQSSYVKAIFPNYEVKATLAESIPLIGADSVWRLDNYGNSCHLNGTQCLTGKGTTIAIIDTGIDYTHPDLGGCIGSNCKVLGGYDFVNNDNDPKDDNGHGTHAAGIAAGNGGGNNWCDGADINKDGKVDGDDYTLWLNCSIKATTCNYSKCDSTNNYCNNADIDRNGIADADDYSIWLNWQLKTRSAPNSCYLNSAGLNGVAPDAKLYGFKVLDKEGSGYVSDIILGVNRAVDLNNNGVPCENVNDYVNVINLSLGGSGNPDDPLSQAVDNASWCTTPIVAAGNEGPSGFSIPSPGVARNAITVGATYKKDYSQFWFNCTPGQKTSCGTCPNEGKVQCDYWGSINPRTDQVTRFSSRGAVSWFNQKQQAIFKPDIVAPGALICSARYDNIYPAGNHPYYYPCSDDKHLQIAGTSMAAPIVAGAAALLKQKHADWGARDIKLALRNTAKNLGEDFNVQGYGRLDILKAVQLKAKPLTVALDSTLNISRGDTINIKGTVKGENFKSYSLYYGIGLNPSQWVKIAESNIPIDNGIIYSGFNTGIFPVGVNYFKLVGLNKFEEKSEEIQVVIFLESGVKKISKTKSFPYNNDNYGNPSISGNKIVWQGDDDYMIYMYDLSTNQEKIISSGRNPSISGNKIVWQGMQGGKEDLDIYMYDLSTNKTKSITTDLTDQTQPFISGNRIVWTDSRNGLDKLDIYMYDLTTDKETRISYSGRAFSPKISGDKIVWKDSRNSVSYDRVDLYAYDLITKQEKRITTDSAELGRSFSISGNKIVWDDWRATTDDGSQSDIYMYDLSMNQERKITNDFYLQADTFISGNKIFWIEYGYKGYIYSANSASIMMYDLATGKKKIISIYAGPKEELSSSGDKAVWKDRRALIWHIYVYDGTQ